MKSRMDKYYEDEDKLQRTSRNSTLYEDIYSEKKEPTDNVTVFDNVNEIDIEKIKNIVNSREDYKKLKRYEDVMGTSDNDFSLEEKNDVDEDESKYDINKMIKSKKSELKEDENKVRKISEIQYEVLSTSEIPKDNSDLVCDQEKNIRELMNTVTDTDLFANLKEKDNTESVSECSFYTNTVSFEKEDFDVESEEETDEEPKGSSVFLKIIIILSFLIAIGVFVWFKFYA